MCTLVVHTHFVFVLVDNSNNRLFLPVRNFSLARKYVFRKKGAGENGACNYLHGGGKTNRKKLFLIEELFYFTQIFIQYFFRS